VSSTGETILRCLFSFLRSGDSMKSSLIALVLAATFTGATIFVIFAFRREIPSSESTPKNAERIRIGNDFVGAPNPGLPTAVDMRDLIDFGDEFKPNKLTARRADSSVKKPIESDLQRKQQGKATQQRDASTARELVTTEALPQPWRIVNVASDSSGRVAVVNAGFLHGVKVSQQLTVVRDGRIQGVVRVTSTMDQTHCVVQARGKGVALRMGDLVSPAP
jgi:hypothetical protein